GCHLLCQTKCARMAYAQAQAPERGTRESRLNIAQAVMAGMTATLLQLYLTRLQVEFVMEDEDFFRCELVKPHERPCGLARTIHEGGRLRQDDRSTVEACLCHPCRKRLLKHERRLQIVGQMVGQPEARIVPRRFVFGTGVAQA